MKSQFFIRGQTKRFLKKVLFFFKFLFFEWKRNAVFLLFLIFSYNLLFSQEWEKINSPTGNIREVFFVNSNHGWIIDFNNIIYHTSDGGNTWESQRNMSKIFLISIYFSDTLNGWCVGDSSIILRTKDGGKTWIEKVPRNNFILYSIYFKENYGWVVGHLPYIEWIKYGVILRTTDYGETWYNIQDTTLRGLKSVYFIDKRTGWAAGPQDSFDFLGKPYLIYTSDSGNTWKEYNLPKEDLYIGALVNVKFFNNKNGWAAGWGSSVFRTINGGEKWEWINVKKYSTIPYSNICVLDSENIWLSDWGNVYHTTDGGSTWNMKEMHQKYPALTGKVFFPDKKTGYFVNSSGIILKYFDETVKVQEIKSNYENNVLYNNYPNPANPNTVISYYLSNGSYISLKVFNILGKAISTLKNGYENAGYHSVIFNSTNLPSGIYFYELSSTGFKKIKKMALIK